MTSNRVSISDVLVARKRIKGFALETPLAKSQWLSEVSKSEVWLKLENIQNTGSFKLRGALNVLGWAREKGISKVFTASMGNHALAIAQAAHFTDREATICLPDNAASKNAKKLKKLNQFNISIIKHGDEQADTEQYARRMAQEKKGLYVSPYNNPEVICGQGTIALELFERVPKLSTIVVAVGGGGLISGIATAAKTINPSCRIVGVAAASTPAMYKACQQGRITNCLIDPTLADSLAGNLDVDTITFPLVRELVDEWVLVDEAEISATIYDFFENEGMLIEGAAACAVAAVSRRIINFKPREKVAVVVCGGNIAKDAWKEIFAERLSKVSSK